MRANTAWSWRTSTAKTRKHSCSTSQVYGRVNSFYDSPCMLSESIEWFIKTRLSCFRMIRFLAHPLPILSCQQVFLFCQLPGVKGWARSQITRPRESLAFYQTFNTLCMQCLHNNDPKMRQNGFQDSRRWHILPAIVYGLGCDKLTNGYTFLSVLTSAVFRQYVLKVIRQFWIFNYALKLILLFYVKA